MDKEIEVNINPLDIPAMMIEFHSKYPRTAEYTSSINPNYPMSLKSTMILNVSMLMLKLEKGYYNKYFTHHPDNKIIDTIGFNYLSNFTKWINIIYEQVSNYELINEQIQEHDVIKPDFFINKLFTQNSSSS